MKIPFRQSFLHDRALPVCSAAPPAAPHHLLDPSMVVFCDAMTIDQRCTVNVDGGGLSAGLKSTRRERAA
ncbi:hypothetical protein Y032_0010g1052 [Ancylostoma ceylanicum]|uniref:Uncharacterized protein n=1 Tax=Ancylostoma ceylanicum TaxID=53326 RepID=A0A016VHK6_9BILA|nr:hypothetical protein Y032_0010g1052 [Ancylostoma ceylanicum]